MAEIYIAENVSPQSVSRTLECIVNNIDDANWEHKYEQGGWHLGRVSFGEDSYYYQSYGTELGRLVLDLTNTEQFVDFFEVKTSDIYISHNWLRKEITLRTAEDGFLLKLSSILAFESELEASFQRLIKLYKQIGK